MSVKLLSAGADLFTCGAHTITNPVNCQGVMGAGLAKAFADRSPGHLRWYEQQCREHRIVPGQPQLDRGDGTRPWILAFPTKRHWRDASRLEDIDTGLRTVARRLSGSGIESLGLPALGCGLGGLAFDDVLDLVEQQLGRAGISVLVIPPASDR